ncbi:2-oxoglutarate dehydrogenase E1 subunit family protein, partial [Mycolicibacter minnesotensis]
MSGISSPFGQNEWLVEEMYRKFREDPSSVDPSWHEFLADYSPDAPGDSARLDGGESRLGSAQAPGGDGAAAPAATRPAPAAQP